MYYFYSTSTYIVKYKQFQHIWFIHCSVYPSSKGHSIGLANIKLILFRNREMYKRKDILSI